jgi:hypothetical protein
MTWLPIDTFPRDRSYPYDVIIAGRYPNGVWYVETSYFDSRGYWHGRKLEPPTHWMPLPDPPFDASAHADRPEAVTS